MQTANQSLYIFARVTAGVFGGYVFTWGCTTLGISAMVALGLPYHEARIAVMLFAFLIFLSAFLWAFAAASIARVWLVLGLGGAVMTTLAWWLQRSLIG